MCVSRAIVNTSMTAMNSKCNFYLKCEIGDGDLVTIKIKVFETTNVDELILN